MCHYIFGVDRISRELFNQTAKTSYYLYDPRGSVAGLADAEGHLTKTYRYSVTGEVTYGAAVHENEYTYNGESYNPNIHSQYLRARYYCVVTANFLTEDGYLGNINEPLTLNRYNYAISSYLNYNDPSGNGIRELWDDICNFLKSITGYSNREFISLESLAGTLEPSPEPDIFDQGNRSDDNFLNAGLAGLLKPHTEEEYIRLAEEYANAQSEKPDCNINIEEQSQAGQYHLQTWEFSYLDKDGNTIVAVWTISNEEFVDSFALSQQEITEICDKHNSELVKRGFDTSIYQIAIAKGINPKVILATLAHEQGWCKNGRYDKAFGVGLGGEPMSFEAESKGGLATAIDTYLSLYNEGLAYEESSGLPTLTVNQDKSPYKETKGALGEGTQKWQAENAQYVIYMEQGIEIIPVNAAMYAKLRYTPWFDFPPQKSHPVETWLEIYNSLKGD